MDKISSRIIALVVLIYSAIVVFKINGFATVTDDFDGSISYDPVAALLYAIPVAIVLGIFALIMRTIYKKKENK